MTEASLQPATAQPDLFSGPVPDHVPPELVQTFNYLTDPDFLADPHGACSALIESAPRIFYSPGVAGGWIVSHYEDVRAVLQDTATFSSRGIARIVERKEGEEGWDLIPLEVDPPKHGKYRAMLNPIFAPREVDRLDADIRRVTANLIDRFADRGRCEFVADFARPLPTTIFVAMMGLPEDRSDEFVEWTSQLLHSHNPAGQEEATQKIVGLLAGLFEARKREPTEDLIGKIVSLRIDGEPLTDADLMGFGFLLFVAGLDTVTSTLSNIFRFLAENGEARRRLAASPELIPDALEEFLRAFAGVNTGRWAVRDHVIQGVEIKAGDKVLCFMPAANRDPQVFEDPRTVDPTRQASQHIAFSSGPHRCIGSHLARREIKVALEAFLARLPDFELDGDEPPARHGGGVWGHQVLPLRWGAANTAGG